MRSRISEFDLAMPESLDSAVAMLASGEGWRPIAGGTDLMVLLNAGKLPYKKLLTLRKLDELRQISVTNNAVHIGGAATYSHIQRHPVLEAEFPLLCQAARSTGGIANQNQGTLGGNIANASPAADSAPPLLVYHAQIHLVSNSGTRKVPYTEFHLGYKQLAMRADELIQEIELPRPVTTWRSYGRKVGTRRAQAISKVSFAAAARIEGGNVLDIRLALGSVAPVPLRCTATERFLLQTPVTQAAIAHACQTLESEIRPIDDIRSTAVYRSAVAKNILAEFLGTLG